MCPNFLFHEKAYKQQCLKPSDHIQLTLPSLPGFLLPSLSFFLPSLLFFFPFIFLVFPFPLSFFSLPSPPCLLLNYSRVGPAIHRTPMCQVLHVGRGWPPRQTARSAPRNSKHCRSLLTWGSRPLHRPPRCVAPTPLQLYWGESDLFLCSCAPCPLSFSCKPEIHQWSQAKWKFFLCLSHLAYCLLELKRPQDLARHRILHSYWKWGCSQNCPDVCSSDKHLS